MGVVCVCVCVCACVHTHAYTQSAQLHPTLCFPGEPIAHQAPLFMEFSRQEYWSGLPFSSPGDLPNPGSETVSPVLAGEVFTAAPPGKPRE